MLRHDLLRHRWYMNKTEKGRMGEEIAAGHIVDKGFKVLERGFRCQTGEIDMVAEKKGELYFIEVKTRWSVTPWKQKRLIKAARYYLAKNRCEDAVCHLSAIGVDMVGASPGIEFIEDAFEYNH